MILTGDTYDSITPLILCKDTNTYTTIQTPTQCSEVRDSRSYSCSERMFIWLLAIFALTIVTIMAFVWFSVLFGVTLLMDYNYNICLGYLRDNAKTIVVDTVVYTLQPLSAYIRTVIVAFFTSIPFMFSFVVMGYITFRNSDDDDPFCVDNTLFLKLSEVFGQLLLGVTCAFAVYGSDMLIKAMNGCINLSTQHHDNGCLNLNHDTLYYILFLDLILWMVMCVIIELMKYTCKVLMRMRNDENETEPVDEL